MCASIAARALADFVPLRAEASSIGPFVRRGVLVDPAAAQGVHVLPSRAVIDANALEETLAGQGAELRHGDAVLICTGYCASGAPTSHEHHGAGLDHGAAVWLAERGASASPF